MNPPRKRCMRQSQGSSCTFQLGKTCMFLRCYLYTLRCIHSWPRGYFQQEMSNLADSRCTLQSLYCPCIFPPHKKRKFLHQRQLFL
jgi:hypothetical protein